MKFLLKVHLTENEEFEQLFSPVMFVNDKILLNREISKTYTNKDFDLNILNNMICSIECPGISKKTFCPHGLELPSTSTLCSSDNFLIKFSIEENNIYVEKYNEKTLDFFMCELYLYCECMRSIDRSISVRIVRIAHIQFVQGYVVCCFYFNGNITPKFWKHVNLLVTSLRIYIERLYEFPFNHSEKSCDKMCNMKFIYVTYKCTSS